MTGEKRIAVVDIGSNTANLAVFAVDAGGAIACVAERDQPLQLLRRLGADGMLSNAAISATVQVIRDYVQQALAMEVDAVELLSTSAVRDAPNRADLVERVRAEVGLPLRVLDGEAEAQAAVTGVVNSVPLVDGYVVDLGGGSLQVTQVAGRRAVRLASVPLGALRLTDQFVRADPPDGPTVNILRRHIDRTLESLGWLREVGGAVVGVGGTIRTLARMSRRAGEWPLPHNHGYHLTFDEVESSWEVVSRMDFARRAQVPGLPAQRVELAVAGTLVVRQLMRFACFPAIDVSGAGVREGAALAHRLGAEALIPDIREAGLRARFGGTPEDLEVAARARAAAEALFDAVAGPLELDPTLRDTFAIAARLRAAWDRRPPVPGPLSALLERPVQGFFQREILAVADLVSPVPRLRVDLANRARLVALLDVLAAAEWRSVQTRIEPESVRVDAPLPAELVERLERAFQRRIVVAPD